METTTGMTTLLVATSVIGAAWRVFKARAPRVLHVAMEWLTVAWAFAFAWLLVHSASELMPARKHDSFGPMAVATAGLVAFVVALVPPRRRAVVAGVLAALLAFLGFSDIIYMRYFGGVMPVAASGSAVLLWDVRDSIAELVLVSDAWMLALGAAGVVVAATWRTPPREKVGRRWVPVVLWLVPVLATVAGPIAVQVDVSRFLKSKWAKEVLNREDNVWNAGILGAHVREISLTLKHWWDRRPLNDEEREELLAYYRERHAQADTASLPGWRTAEGKNLLVLQWEALEQWVIGAKVNGREVTPFVNRLLGESIYYPVTFDQVASSSTSDCEYLVLNSQHPLRDGSVAFRRVDNHFVTLGTTLKEEGYNTLSMHAYRRGMWNRAVLHPKWGFDRSLFEEELGARPKIGWGLDDAAFFARAADELTTLAQDDDPFFAFLITLTSHHPYRYLPRRHWKLKLPGNVSRTMMGGYLQSIAYVDDAMEAFFAELDKRGVLNETVVVIYGDHDANIRFGGGQRKALQRVLDGVPPPMKARVGETGWWRERVPVIVRLPNGEGGGTVVDTPGGQIDVAPTALHFLGVEPPLSFLGRARVPGRDRGMVAKWNGNGVDPAHTWNEKTSYCARLDDASRAKERACEALAEAVKRELKMSWWVTENDLAPELAAAGGSWRDHEAVPFAEPEPDAPGEDAGPDDAGRAAE